MIFKTAVTSLLLAALAPGLHAQQEVPAGSNLGVITFATNNIPERYPIAKDTCVSRITYVYSTLLTGDTFTKAYFTSGYVLTLAVLVSISSGVVSDIYIAALPVYDGVQCTVYSETGCEGDQLTLDNGDHQFTRDFVAGSFECTV
ncbi:hypothetical protein BDV06DRAFT_224274 [Aspergillus oleicola]